MIKADLPALTKASQWFAILAADNVSDKEKLAWQQWLAESEANQQAWQQIQALNVDFAKISPEIGLATLSAPNPSRRILLKHLSLTLGAGAFGAYVYKTQAWQPYLADYSTQTGAQQSLTLADNTQIHLNTDTAINVVFSDKLRLIELIKGEVHIETGHDAQNRPFKVNTRHGNATALGTRFTVRDFRSNYLDYTEVSLFDGIVEIRPQASNNAIHTLQAGKRIRFNAHQIYSPEQNKPTDAAWIKGFIVAYEMPLSTLSQELARYRQGILRCSPTVAQLKVSGSFPTKNTDTALRIIADNLPVNIKTYTPFWVVIQPNSATQ